MKTTFYLVCLFILLLSTSCEDMDWRPICEKNNTGNWCFINQRDQDINILVDGSIQITINEGETGCLDISVGPHSIRIVKNKLIDINKTIAEFAIVVEQCVDNEFVVN